MLFSFPERLGFRGVNWKWPRRAINRDGASCQHANRGARAVIVSRARPRDGAAGVTWSWGQGGHVDARTEVTREQGM